MRWCEGFGGGDDGVLVVGLYTGWDLVGFFVRGLFFSTVFGERE